MIECLEALFLYGASTQEETICYNSNTYRDVLDFKYQRFDGGFMIPEFADPSVNRNVDVIAVACYDLTGVHGLHIKTKEDEFLESCPIGCGAFENDTTTIIKLWKNVLSSPLNENSKTKQHDAFKEIWFLDVKDMIN
ncbi:unnamed protein product [Rotaria magnacalcarata]|uniref:Uncharacterized protein n=1 Tax=Rotaria magnacalcarata TaxID=392030 RepID=A0A816UIM9_9BILA|nr:unnamed protein product [Rotaria magnacalcarata]